MFNVKPYARKSSTPLRPFRVPPKSLLAALLLSLLTTSFGCGTPVIKVDTSTCNRPEWTKRAPEELPPLTSKVPKEALKNHEAVVNEYRDLKDRHDPLAECVEVNSRG